jgi:hypothetical protein
MLARSSPLAAALALALAFTSGFTACEPAPVPADRLRGARQRKTDGGVDEETPTIDPVDGGGVDVPPGTLETDPPFNPTTFTMELRPQTVDGAPRRINFAVPLPPGAITSPDKIRVRAANADVPTGRRALAKWPNGSLRSVQIQLDLAVAQPTMLSVSVGGEATSTGNLPLVPVESTLVVEGVDRAPAVWAVLPASWLSASRVAGPSLPSADVAGTPMAKWDALCDYARFNTAAFRTQAAEAGSWLYDRPTAFYRGYQRNGSLEALRAAYAEAELYRSGLTGSGNDTRIGIPSVADDIKYHYTQALAIHYLLTGDDRFREAAENVAIRAHDLWSSPEYENPMEFWTERHAGFGLLAYEWAAAVSDDRAATFTGWAATAVAAYLDMQKKLPAGYTSTTERCFAHTGSSHGEEWTYWGCSPWMSAILADGLDAHADRLAREGKVADAAAVRGSLVLLGRFVANQGRDAEGRPFYWAGVGVPEDEPDDFEEHWGEAAYVVALAWAATGKKDAALKKSADELVAGFAANGEAGQIRSFNWQCRSAVMTPFLLRP